MTRSYGAVSRCVSVSVAALVLAFLPSTWRLAVALLLLLQLTATPPPAAVARLLLHPVSSELLTLRTSSAQVRARRYAPFSASSQAAPKVLLLHGVHALGIDEPRLVAFARALASTGLDVLTPELRPLMQYEVSERVVADIAELARAWAEQQHTRSVGVIGISFAGGLSLMAAAAQSGRAPIGFVLSVGAHEDLTRVCEFYAGQEPRGPNGERSSVAPHPYGPRVLLRKALPSLVSAADLPLAGRVLDTYLHDRLQSAKQLAADLSPTGRAVASVLLDQHGSDKLSRWLLETCSARRQELLAASPSGHLQGLQVPVLLLHGSDDPVVPSIETRYLERDVPPAALRDVLITDLLRHAELNQRPQLGQIYRFGRFVQRLLAVAGSMQAANARASR